ncbi:hypothetical protein AB3S75_038023 [Citrus x aurantiifolia]
MKKNNSKSDQSNEVEKLLEAAHDEMLLKLSVDSHIASISSNYLDADLDRRFQALRSRPSVPRQSKSQSATPSQSQTRRNVSVDDELKSSLGDDLSARFAALKASSSSSSANDDNKYDGVDVGPKIPDGDVDDGEDEVEKIIRWAKDAARLDPSAPSDDDKDSDRDTDSDSDGDEEQPQRNKGRRKQ